MPPDAPVTTAVRVRRSQVFAQSQRVVDRGVDVATGDCVADAEQLVAVAVDAAAACRRAGPRSRPRRRCAEPFCKAKYSSSLASTPWSTTTASTVRVCRTGEWSLPTSTISRPPSRRTVRTRWFNVMRVSVSLNARAYGTMLRPPTSTPTVRSGVTISSRAPDRASISAVVIAECVPSSSYSNTSPLSRASPPTTSHADTTRSSPASSSGFCGRPPVATMTTSGCRSRDDVLVGVGVDAHVDTQPGQFAVAPLDDAHQVLASRVARREPDLATGPRHRLEQHDVVPALGADPGRLQTAGTAADDHDTSATGGARDVVRHGLLAPGGRVVDAQRLARLIDAIEAVGRADARPDRVLDAELDLADEVRLGHLGAGHADHVDAGPR